MTMLQKSYIVQQQQKIRHFCYRLRQVKICHSLPVCFQTLKIDIGKALAGIKRERILDPLVKCEIGFGQTIIENFL